MSEAISGTSSPPDPACRLRSCGLRKEDHEGAAAGFPPLGDIDGSRGPRLGANGAPCNEAGFLRDMGPSIFPGLRAAPVGCRSRDEPVAPAANFRCRWATLAG